MASSYPLFVSSPLLSSSESSFSLSLRATHLHSPTRPSLWRKRPLCKRGVAPPFAITESDSLKSSNQEESLPLLPLLQELADSFDLPSDYFAKLPRDLRLDLNDAAFDLSNGPVINECGQELGEMLLNLAQAWEQADTSTSLIITKQFQLLEGSLTNNVKTAFGKRLISAGRRFTSMGQYGQGELQRIANAMIKTGKLLSPTPGKEIDEKLPAERRVLKFGELQVELTPEKAYTGSAIAFFFGILSWGLAQGIQSVPESSLQYANGNALLLAKSLRGALLSLGYSSAALSAAASVGLLLLGQQLSSESISKKP